MNAVAKPEPRDQCFEMSFESLPEYFVATEIDSDDLNDAFKPLRSQALHLLIDRAVDRRVLVAGDDVLRNVVEFVRQHIELKVLVYLLEDRRRHQKFSSLFQLLALAPQVIDVVLLSGAHQRDHYVIEQALKRIVGQHDIVRRHHSNEDASEFVEIDRVRRPRESCRSS